MKKLKNKEHSYLSKSFLDRTMLLKMQNFNKQKRMHQKLRNQDKDLNYLMNNTYHGELLMSYQILTQELRIGLLETDGSVKTEQWRLQHSKSIKI